MNMEHWWNYTDREKVLGEKPVIVPLCPPQILHMYWHWIEPGPQLIKERAYKLINFHYRVNNDGHKPLLCERSLCL